MIKNIIKRNGKIEEFDANKLNMWGEWASKTLGKGVAWGDVVINAVTTLPENTTSVDLQNALIDVCLSRRTWSYNRMAGRLYASTLYKQAFNHEKDMMLSDKTQLPTIREVHENMLEHNIISKDFVNAYSENEYAVINSMLRHSLDMTYPHFQLKQIIGKYSLKDRTGEEIFETPQYVYMRVAMRVSQNLGTGKERLEHIRKFYYYYSHNKINIPTPYFTNAGIANGFNSCCVYRTSDTARSLAVGDHIAYTMTYSSAGIGAFLQTRSEGSPIRGGIVKHRGKMMYYRSLVGAVDANTQNGRGGSATVTYECIDPDYKTIQAFKNPLTPASKQVRGIDYSMAFNKFFMAKAATNQEIALFSVDDAPEVYKELVGTDTEKFREVYEKAIADGKAKSFVNAREILLGAVNQAVETGRHYVTNLTEMNTHTPFYDPIYQSNLCQEIAIPTEAYESMQDLYSTDENVVGEVGMCSLAATVVSNIESDEEYADVAFYCLLMIYMAINESNYEIPHIGMTAKARNNAGVGISGLAHYMAKKQLSFDSVEGKKEMHELAETHYWHLLKASLKMSKMFGNAKWMHKTKWPKGWLPIDTYNKNVDTIADFENKRDWEAIRKEVIKNGGIHNSVLVAHMPCESSSISSGTTNGLYPVRGLTLNKSNDDDSIAWIAPDADKLEKHYQNAYLVNSIDMIQDYAIFQKWTDQGISADLHKVVVGADKLSSTELLKDTFALVKYGCKSRYYVHSRTSKEMNLNSSEAIEEADDCCKI